MRWPEKVFIAEVGPRDGLQGYQRFVPTRDKLRLIIELLAIGVQRIEVTSFVNPKVIPQFADADELVGQLPPRPPGVEYSAIVLNPRGAERAAAHRQIGVLTTAVSVSEAHSRKNVGCGVDEGLKRLEEIVSVAKAGGRKVNVTLATAFGCPYTGAVSPDRVVVLAQRAAAMGVEEITLGDTTGVGVPRQVAGTIGRLAREVPGVKLGIHCHDTRGAALVNTIAAITAGAELADASIGGAGASIYLTEVPGNNVATEDLIHALEYSGVRTGVDLSAGIRSARLAEELIGEKLPGRVMRAGTREELIAWPGQTGTSKEDPR